MPVATDIAALPQVLSYGGGLDSWIMLYEGVRRGDVPEVVAFCDVTDPDRKDPGEWPGTYRHIEQVVIPFCNKHGIKFEWIDTVRYPVRNARSLFAWMEERQQVPVSGPTRICTKIAKVERFEAWLADAYPGQVVSVWIGFEAGEESRANKDPNVGKPNATRVNRFPLIEWALCRCACEAIAIESGLPVPRKSACVYCPYASRCDWQNFAKQLPTEFNKIVKLEADRPLTRNGEKMAIKGFGKKRKDGTRSIQLLDEWVTKPGRPRPPVVCEVCGEVRATKETAADWLSDGDADTLNALTTEAAVDTDPRPAPALITADMPFNTGRIITLNLGLGRDSFAMLGLLIEGELVVDGRKLTPADIDAVVCSDTGAEWKHTLKALANARELCFENDIRFLYLRKPAAQGPKGWRKFHADKARGVEFGNTEDLPWMNRRLSIEERASSGFYHRRAPIIEDFGSRQTVVSLQKGDCTDNHKILPIRRLINDLAVARFGINNRRWAHAKSSVRRHQHITLIGIAADESGRVKEYANAPKFITERYPLIEMDIAKTDEQPILERHGLGHIRKSGCDGCPFQPASWFFALQQTNPTRWQELLDYEAVAVAKNPKMFITGKKPLPEFVANWRAKHPDATLDAILDKSYGRGCAAIKKIKALQEEQARLDRQAEKAEAKHAEEMARFEADTIIAELDAETDFDPSDDPAECTNCGDNWFYSSNSHYMIDARVDNGAADAFITFSPCCEHTAAQIETHGYEFVTGRTIKSVVTEIIGFEVLKITYDGDGAIVCRLQLDNPTRVLEGADKHGNHKAASRSGWQTEVFDSVTKHHRHHERPTGWKFGIAVYNGPVKVGVAIIERPKSRVLEQAEPKTLEVTRVATWGHPALRKNASSKLYAAAAKQARALGYDKLITYTLYGEEDGHSVRTAGWLPTRMSGGGSWDRESRPRTDSAPTGKKVRWAKGLIKRVQKRVNAAAIELDQETDRLAA